MIKDAETVEEAETIRQSDEESSDDDIPNEDGFHNGSILTNEDQQRILKESIAKRASLLASVNEKEKEAPVNTVDVEMNNEDSFEEIAVEDCSSEEDKENPDEDLF